MCVFIFEIVLKMEDSRHCFESSKCFLKQKLPEYLWLFPSEEISREERVWAYYYISALK